MKVALLTNFIPPYRRSQFEAVSKNLKDFTIFISVGMEKNRSWNINHGKLAVEQQKVISYSKKWKNNYTTQVHIPYNTFFELKKYNPSIVISTELGFRSLLSVIYCKLYKKKAIIWLTLSEHTEKDRKGLRLILRRFILRNADAAFCNGESAMQYARTINGKLNLIKVPTASDYEILDAKTKTSSRTLNFILSGQLIERKGIKELVDGIKFWSEKNKESKIKLIVAGDGPEKIQFNRLDTNDNVELELLGNVSYDQLQQRYRKVDFCIFPTLGDEWGLVVNEAFACGTPVIGSIYSQAVTELVEEGKTGWQYNPLENNSLVKRLGQLNEMSDAEYFKLSQNCIRSISEITTEKIANTILTYIVTPYKSETYSKLD